MYPSTKTNKPSLYLFNEIDSFITALYETRWSFLTNNRFQIIFAFNFKLWCTFLKLIQYIIHYNAFRYTIRRLICLNKYYGYNAIQHNDKYHLKTINVNILNIFPEYDIQIDRTFIGMQINYYWLSRCTPAICSWTIINTYKNMIMLRVSSSITIYETIW